MSGNGNGKQPTGSEQPVKANPPAALSYFDAEEIATRIREDVECARELFMGWRAIPPAPSERDGNGYHQPPPPWPVPSPPRYSQESIDAELAMILYRAACRLGLHATGTEAGLIRLLERAEAELAASKDEEILALPIEVAEVLGSPRPHVHEWRDSLMGIPYCGSCGIIQR